MRHQKFLMILPLAFAATGVVKASDFCNDGQFYSDSGGWHGVRCDLVQRTRPLEEEALPIDTGGGTKNSAVSKDAGPIISFPPAPVLVALPDYSDLDLRRYYSPDSLPTPVVFTFDTSELGMVDPGDGAEVALFQLGLQSRRANARGEEEYCDLTMALADDTSLGNGNPLRFYWNCAYQTVDPDGGDPFTVIDSKLTMTDIGPNVKKLAVSLTPTDNRWTRVVLQIRNPDSLVDMSYYFDKGVILDVPDSLKNDGFLPVSLRAGIISGSLQRPGMTMRYRFFSPEIDEQPPIDR